MRYQVFSRPVAVWKRMEHLQSLGLSSLDPWSLRSVISYLPEPWDTFQEGAEKYLQHNFTPTQM